MSNGHGTDFRARQRLQVPAERCLFVGDDPRWDLVGPRALGMQDRWGTLEVGKLADVIIVPGNPLADMNVMKRGLGGGVMAAALILTLRQASCVTLRAPLIPKVKLTQSRLLVRLFYL